MAGIGLFNEALLNATNTVTGVVDERKKSQANLDITNMQISLERLANQKMEQLKKNNKYNTWEEDMDNFFNEVSGQLDDSNSPFHCKNNYTATMAQSMIERARNSYQANVQKMANDKIRELNIVNMNNSINELQQNYTGQAYIDQANDVVKLAYENGDIGPEQTNRLMDNIYKIGTYNNYVKAFDDDLISKQIAAGRDFNEIWNEYSKGKVNTKRYGLDGLEIQTNSKEIIEQAKKECENRYNAKLASVQLKNYNGHQSNFAEIDQSLLDIALGKSSNIEGLINDVYSKCQVGLNTVNRQDGIQLAKGEQKSIADEYVRKMDAATDLLKAMKSGSPKSVADALKTFKPEDTIKFFTEAWKEGQGSRYGGPSNLYNARDIYEDLVLPEYQRKSGNTNASWNDMAKEYPVVNTFLDYAKKNLPPEMQDIVSTSENLLKEIFNTKENKKLFENEYAAVMDQIYDVMFETDTSTLDTVTKKELNNKVNKILLSNYGSILSKKQKQQLTVEDYVSPDTLSDYKEGVIGKDKTFAKAMWERDNNPQLIYTDQFDKTKRSGTPEIQEGLTRYENDERKILAETLGIDDPTSFISNYENEGTRDRSARKVYTINGNDYRFRSISKDKYVLETKKTGTTEWQETMTKKQEEKYNSPKEAVKRMTVDKELSYPGPIVIQSDNEGETEKLSEEYWNSLSDSGKRRILEQYMQNNSEQAINYLEQLKDKKRAYDPIRDRKKK